MKKVALAASAEVMIVKFVWAVAMDPKLVRNGIAQEPCNVTRASKD